MTQMQSSPRFFDDLSPRQRKRLKRMETKGNQEHMQQRNINVVALTKRQAQLIRAIEQDTQIFILGPAGTGKTYVCASMAAKMYLAGKIDKIVLTRPNVPSGRELGFRPGTEAEKMAPWTVPVVEVLREKLGQSIYEHAVSKGAIEIVPFETMRGRSFNDAFVLLDEAQNCLFEELKTFVTRIGKNSKVIINGDIEQTDLKQDSGYQTILDLAEKYQIPETSIIEFTIDDVVRSGLVRDWLIAFHKEKL